MSAIIYKQCDICRGLFEKGRERHYVCPTCFSRDYSHLEGKEARTPFEPSGIVKVLEVEEGYFDGKRSVLVEYVEDHPHGYKQGSIGRYFAHELRPIKEGA